MAKALSAVAKLAANAINELQRNPLFDRVVLHDKKINYTAIAYHGDRCDGTDIVVLKNNNC
jgi:hypothetical protein